MTRWFPIAPGTSLPAAPAVVDGQITATQTVPVWNETVLSAAVTRTRLFASAYSYGLSLDVISVSLVSRSQLAASSTHQVFVSSSGSIQLRARVPSVTSGASVEAPSGAVSINAQPPHIACGVAIQPQVLPLQASALQPAYVGVRAVVVEPPAAATHVEAHTPMIRGGVRVDVSFVSQTITAHAAGVARTAPFYVGQSTSASTASYSLFWPTGHLKDDIGLLIIEGSGADTTLTPPSGWQAVSGSPVTDVVSTAGSKLQVWWRRAQSSSESAVTVPDGGDHQIAALALIRGCAVTGDPWDAVATGTKTVASTTATAPSVTTTRFNTFVISIVGRPDDSSSTTHFGPPVNNKLQSLTEYLEYGSTTGNGGGFVVAGGELVMKGTSGTTTFTKTSSTTDTYFVLGLRGY